MGPKRTQYESCRKAITAFALVETFGELGNDLRKARYDLENEFSTVKSEVDTARRRFEKARSRYSDIHKLLNDSLFDEQEKTELRALWAKAGAELIKAEEAWNDI